MNIKRIDIDLYMSAIDFARMVKRKPPTIYSAIERGKIKNIVRVGKSILIHKKELENY